MSMIVGEAENGKQALQQIAELKPDLVFLDLQMPVMGGFEVVRKLRGGHLPVVVIVTAFDQHAIEAFEAGAVDYLLKPVGEERLRKARRTRLESCTRIHWMWPTMSPKSWRHPHRPTLSAAERLSGAMAENTSCWIRTRFWPFRRKENWYGSSPQNSGSWRPKPSG